MKEISVLGRKVKIASVSETEMTAIAKKAGLDEGLYGVYIDEDSTLYIWSGVDGDLYAETLLHEIFHAYFSRSGYDELLGDKQEEALCKLFEIMIHELFRNKQFVEYVAK